MRFTAVPSAMVLASGRVTSLFFFSASVAEAAPEGSTPTIFISGLICLAAQAIPEMSPPPPIGTTITSVCGNCSRISRAIVPCPSSTSGSLKGWTNT